VTSAVGVGADGAASIGRYLARQRRLRGVSLEDLVELTRIPKRSLERLEDGAFDDQADGFSRGFVRTVAEALGLDAEDAVMRLLGEPDVGDEEFAVRRHSLRRWAVGTLVLLGGAAAVAGLWTLASGVGRDEGAASEIVYRRDAVRELAEMQRSFGDGPDRLEFPGEGNPD
jgi:transcriptional regulator with XRE-family HTH domain